MADEVDPWDWTPNQVVDAFCHNRTLWQHERPHSALPNPASFEAILREQDVNGATLLSDVTPQLLKEEFQIKSLGQRSSIVWAIEQLRKRSRKYITQCPGPTPGFATHHSIGSFYPNTPRPYRPYPPFHAQPPDIYSPPPSNRHLFQHHDGSTEGGSSPTFARPSLPGRPAPIDNQSSPQDFHPPRHDTSSEDATSSKRRIGETMTEDSTGRRKRRLDLSTGANPAISTQTPAASAETVCHSSAAKDTSFVTAETSVLANPSAAATQSKQLDLRSQLCGLEPGASSYLGKNKFSLEDMFFGSSECGKPLNAELDMVPLTAKSSLPGQVFTFTAGKTKSIHGRQSAINRRMICFLSQRQDLEVETTEDALAFFPYPASSSLVPNSRSLINLKESNGEVAATRQRLPQIPGEEQGLDSGSTPSNHEWDFLDNWHQEDKKEMPAYMESDSEPDSELNSLDEEMKADRDEDQEAAKAQLSPEQVATIIDEAIADQVRQWREKRFPVLQEQKALSIWRKGRTSRERLILAELARAEIGKCDAYLDKIKSRIMNDCWDARRKLRQQCESFEETVKRREEERFKLATWQRPNAPPPPSGKLRTRKKRSTHVSSNNAEHMVDGDEEVVDDREDLSDFFHVDQLVPLDLTTLTSEEAHDDGQRQDDPDEAAPEVADEMEEDDTLVASKQDLANQDMKSDSHRHDDDETDDDSTDNAIKEEPMPQSNLADKGQAKTRSEVIDLTFDSDTDEPASQHVPAVPRPSHTATQSMRWSSCPENDPDEEIADWEWFDLEQNDDRRRIIIKLTRTMPPREYRRLREHVLEDNGDDTRPKVYELAENAQMVLRKHHGQEQRFELVEYAYDRADELLHLYVCWLEISPQYFRLGYDIKQVDFELVSLEKAVLEAALKQMGKDESLDLLTCFEFIHTIFLKHANPLSEEVDADSNTEELNAEGSQLTPHKQRRKREVAESQFALSKRSKNRKTAIAWEDRSRLFLSQQQAQSSDLVPTDEGIVVNTGKEKNEEAILVNPYIAGSLKRHQVDGIRFMWREAVGTADDSEDTQGCLLAHTMGLGKTLQVIAFITTLDQAAKSTNTTIREQIPMKLRNMRILILCPAGLISNWVDEFAKWNKNKSAIAVPLIITAQTPKDHRLRLLDEWYKTARGSVLLMGYELFRIWALNSKHARREPAFTEDEHKEVKEKLLRGPTLIIADEAHKLKNHDSQVTKAAKMLKTRSRIALTGSPLSNNLLEYFAMVDWIAPGYLGELVEFKANYVEPIEDGLYLGSTQYERKKARVKLAALIEILEPKIHRREIDALQGILQAKVQFVLKVPLTSVQAEIYRAFVKMASSGIDDSVSNARLWGLMAYLQLLCSHPSLFEGAVQTAREKQRAAREKRAKSPIKRGRQLQDEAGKTPAVDGDDTDHSDETRDNADDDGSAPSDSVSLQIAEKVLADLADVFAPVLAAAEEVQFSHKTNLLLQIVQKSKAANDKLLIFSHRLPTLDYLGKALDKAGIRWARLDGSTQMNKRQQMTKSFNEGNKYDVFLISTRAGGIGFNLHGANRVVLFDFSFNPTWEEQAIGRAFRLGQQKPVFVYRFISAGTFEEALFNQTVFKMQLAYQVVEKKNTRSKAVRVRDYIKMPSDSHLENLSEEMGNDKILDAIIESMEAGNELIHEIKLDTTFKEEVKESLDEEGRKEMEQLVQQNQLRNTDPEAYRAQMAALAARMYAPASTARPGAVNPILNPPVGHMPAPTSTTPVARMIPPPARSIGSATKIPPAAHFKLPATPKDELHGLPYPSAPQFSIGSSNVASPFPVGSMSGPANGGSSQIQGQGQQGGT